MSDGSSEFTEPIPFNSPLVDAGFGNPEKLRQLQNNREVIIRTEPGHPSIEQLSGTKRLLTELTDKYHIPAVKADFVVGPLIKGLEYEEDVVADPINDRTIYTVTERVHGDRLDEIIFKPQSSLPSKETIEDHLDAVLFYYQDKQLAPQFEGVLYDIDRADQYMLGRKAGDTEAKIYLVDISWMDAAVNQARSLQSRQGGFHSNLANIIEDVERFEIKFGRLARTRDTIRKALDMIPVSHFARAKYSKQEQYIREFLGS